MNCEQESGQPIWPVRGVLESNGEREHFGWFLPVRIEKGWNSRNTVEAETAGLDRAGLRKMEEKEVSAQTLS